MHRLVVLFMAASVLAVAAMVRAQNPLGFSSEIFVTMAWGTNGITSGTTGIDNIVIADAGGGLYTLGFSSLTLAGNGVYGTIYPDGPYQLEFFWFGIAYPNGFTGGHSHFISTGGNPGDYEATHGNGFNQNQGVRITRTDGQALAIISLDYKEAWVPFLIGTSFSGYASLANYSTFGVNEGLVLNDPNNWRQLTIGTPPSASPIDLSILTIVAPSQQTGGCSPLSATASVSMLLRNVGSATLPAGTIVTCQYVHNSDPAVVETFPLASNLASNGFFQFTFAQPVDLSALINQVVTISATIPGDGNLQNNTATRVVRRVVDSFPWVEDFDPSTTIPSGTTAPPEFWTQSTTDATGAFPDWIFRSGPTPSIVTGPPADHTTGVAGVGFYAHIEDDGENSAVELLTPCIDLGQVTNPVLTFWYHSRNAGAPTAAANTLSIDLISHPAGTRTLNITPPIGSVDDDWHILMVNLAAYSGVVQIVFRGQTNNSGSSHDIAIDDVKVEQGYATDLAIDSVVGPITPAECGLLGASEYIVLRVRNNGVQVLAPGTAIPAQYSLDGAAPVAGTFYLPLPLALGATQDFAFPIAANLASPAVYSLSATIFLPGDQNPANDSVAGHSVFSGGIGLVDSFPWLETFDNALLPSPTATPPIHWSQDASDSQGTPIDWTFINQPTPTATTGPGADHTTGLAGQGFYAYVDDDNEQAATSLLTPCLHIGRLSRPALAFWCHSQNGGAATEALLHIDVIEYPNGATTLDVRPPIGHIGDFWSPVIVDLTGFSSVVKVRFRVTTLNGSPLHDIAIDDVQVSEGNPPGSGDDLELWTTVNGLGVPTLTGKLATAGDFLAVTIRSPAGTFVGAPPILAGQVFFSTAPPTSPIGFPAVHLSPAQAIVLFDGNVQGLFGQSVIGTNGMTLQSQIPPGVGGRVLRLQALVPSPAAANGIFAITDAHDIILF